MWLDKGARAPSNVLGGGAQLMAGVSSRDPTLGLRMSLCTVNFY